jgi:DNA-binding NtrC family response regulator
MTWKVIPGGMAGAQPTRQTNPQAKSANAPAKRARVLVVDDEVSICKALVMALEQAGFEAISALTGEGALDIVRHSHVDVMLIDLRLQDMRGDVVFEFVAGHQPHLRYQSLFMTGDITERAEKLIAACKCHYLQKPFDLRDVTSAVSALAPRAADVAG